MTPTTTTTRTAEKTALRSDAEQLLRDAAFVLRLTRKVKAEIMAERPEAGVTSGNRAPEMAAGLGV
jgi:hypothetical protein